MPTSDRPATTVEWTTEKLRRGILSGAFPQNAPLSQDDIAARFGVSRMPVREAIKRLAAEGLVLERPNRKAIVAALDAEDAEELFLIRAELECLAASRSLPLLSDAQLAAVDRAHRRLEEADPGAYTRRHHRFHSALYAAAGPRLLALIDRHMMQAERYLCYERSRLPVTEEDLAEHRQLRDAALARDAEAAIRVLRPHIAEAGQAIAAALAATEETHPS